MQKNHNEGLRCKNSTAVRRGNDGPCHLDCCFINCDGPCGHVDLKIRTMLQNAFERFETCKRTTMKVFVAKTQPPSDAGTMVLVILTVASSTVTGLADTLT